MLKLVINNRQDKETYERSAIHEEERKLEKVVYFAINNIPEKEKSRLKNNFISRMQIKDIEMRKIIAELELKCFIEQKILYENREKYPNLFERATQKAVKRIYETQNA
jgi:ferric iron reductase protein FhuF